MLKRGEVVCNIGICNVIDLSRIFLFSKIPSQLYATGGSGAKKRWAAATGLLKKMVQFLSSWIAASYLSLNFYFAFIFILLTNNFYFKFPR